MQTYKVKDLINVLYDNGIEITNIFKKHNTLIIEKNSHKMLENVTIFLSLINYGK
jgi:hypothetical protein